MSEMQHYLCMLMATTPVLFGVIFAAVYAANTASSANFDASKCVITNNLVPVPVPVPVPGPTITNTEFVAGPPENEAAVINGMRMGPMINNQYMKFEPTRPFTSDIPPILSVTDTLQTITTHMEHTVRPRGTRSSIHSHDFGGITCVITGEMALKLEGSYAKPDANLVAGGPNPTPMDLEASSGDCYYMPPGHKMSGMNIAQTDAVLYDMFTVPYGQNLIALHEYGFSVDNPGRTTNGGHGQGSRQEGYKPIAELPPVPELFKPKTAEPEQCGKDCQINDSSDISPDHFKFLCREGKASCKTFAPSRYYSETNAMLNPNMAVVEKLGYHVDPGMKYTTQNAKIPGMCSEWGGSVPGADGNWSTNDENNEGTLGPNGKRRNNYDELCTKGVDFLTMTTSWHQGTRMPVSVDPFGGTRCVLYGEMTYVIDGQEDITARSGLCAYIPPATKYSAINTNNGDGGAQSNVNSGVGGSVEVVYHVLPSGEAPIVQVEDCDECEKESPKLGETANCGMARLRDMFHMKSGGARRCTAAEAAGQKCRLNSLLPSA